MINKDSKILIIGANGFLGSYIKKYALRYLKLNIEFARKDLFDLLNYRVIELFQNNVSSNTKYDYIFNCAVYFKPGDFKSHADMYIYNQIMNDNFLRYIKEYQQQATVITFGSDAVYDNRYHKSENSYTYGFPQQDYYGYALSKRNLYTGLYLLELQYKLKSFHFPLISLYGSNYRKNDNHLIHDILRKIIEAKYHNKKAEFFGNGEQIREITYINDVVENIFKIINNKKCQEMVGIFNLGSDIKRKTVKEYVKIICEKLEYDFNKCIFDNSIKIGIDSKTLCNDKAKEYIDYSDIKFEDTLDDVINYSLGLYK